MSEPTDFCARCGADLDPSAAAFSGDGLICKRCEDAESMRDQASRGSEGFGPLGWGILSLFCNPLFIPSILAISGGMRVLSTAKALEATGEATPRDRSERTNAIVGIVLGALYPVALVGMLGLAGVFLVFGAALGASQRSHYDDYDYGAYEPDPYDDDLGSGGDLYGGLHDAPDDDPFAYRDDDVLAAASDEAPPEEASPVEPSPVEPSPPVRPRVGGVHVELEAGRSVRQQIASHVAAARAEGMRPYVYAHAPWCAPCRAVERHRDAPAMRRAYRDVYLIGADIDTIDPDELTRVGVRVRGVPTWFGLDEDGRHDGRTIHSGVWGADVPANMAPPLDAFFHGD